MYKISIVYTHLNEAREFNIKMILCCHLLFPEIVNPGPQTARVLNESYGSSDIIYVPLLCGGWGCVH